jgi:serine/threonine protein kinase
MSQKIPQKRLLQIEAGSANDTSVDFLRRIDDASEEWSVESSSSSSSSWSSDSDDDYHSLDGGIGSNREDTWESYHSHSVEPWTEVYDDSYMTKTASRRRRRSVRKGKKNSPTSTQYQYQISLYIQMQLCHPANLQDWIRERNKQIPETDHDNRVGPAVEIFQQICSGLAHIHKSDVVHRDLKPANIFVSSDGKVIKIGDFGLSKKLKDIVNAHHTSTFERKASTPQQYPPRNSDAIVPVRNGISSMQALIERNKVGNNLTAGIGTASYAAPEQVQSKTYGTAVDIFSLGLIFLELVSCFETEHERLHNLQQCRYQRLPKWIDDHYPDISSTILACTKPNASDRPTADELINIGKLKSPRNQKEVHLLKRQLTEKNAEIAEKNELIKNLRLEIERMRALIVPKIKPSSKQNGDDRTSSGYDRGEEIVVSDAMTFDDDIE